MRLSQKQSDFEELIIKHIELLGHKGYGVTELRVFKPRPQVAYVDNIKDAIPFPRTMLRKGP